MKTKHIEITLPADTVLREDCPLLWNCDMSKPIGRVRKLRDSEDGRGVIAECEVLEEYQRLFEIPGAVRGGLVKHVSSVAASLVPITNAGETPRPTRFEFEGDLKIWTQEGGYVESAIDIGDCSGLAGFLEEELLPEHGEGEVEGRWRITIERID